MSNNPLNVRGIEFLEYSAPAAGFFDGLFQKLGMSKVARHKGQALELWRQHDIRFLTNAQPGSFGAEFAKAHGPSISSMGLQVDDAEFAFNEAVKRGAKPYKGADQKIGPEPIPAIYGIGDSLVYFLDRFRDDEIYGDSFNVVGKERQRGVEKLLRIDHLTNNVPKGEMQRWCDFYEKIFGFEEVRYFDIKGAKTGLISKVMSMPDRSVMIPINEPSDQKSQIQEYLEEYKGSGIQHIALSTANIIESVAEMQKLGVKFLETPPTYYKMLQDRLPNLTEDVGRLAELKLLADGDPKGYLLQIFTKNVIGPIFFEIIQRKDHWGFGNGNFQALFDAIERDQMERGYLK